MVKAQTKFQYLPDGTLDVTTWLATVQNKHHLNDTAILAQACLFTQHITQGLTTFYGQPYLEKGLEIAEAILDLKLDQETAAAGILANGAPFTRTIEENIKKEFSDTIAKLIAGVQQMEIIPLLQKQQQDRNRLQADKIRKMLLAMATDIRVVIIKLAERLCFMRAIKAIPAPQQKRFAEEVFDIYAPLANRLGIGQLKWELEDLAFRYHDPITYKTIATFLAERRTDRENRIRRIIETLKEKMQAAHIDGQVTGRAKHIYSIYLKAKRKHINYKDIYDHSATRILVPTIEDCYTALSIVNSTWPPIFEEFDDYIANPKPNGYRSIHTAVMDEDGKHFEIQIRTNDMHEEAERGVAAHWIYKENKKNPLDDTAKISYLRQLLDWHKELAADDPIAVEQEAMLEDQVYVITPAGDILDLPQGATPLDFAYHIHSELGHRCRGAKTNGHIVPLTYSLRTGDKVEIITIQQGAPSRDWLNPELGYVKTSRARSKIAHWFKQQELNEHVTEGKQIFDKELSRAGHVKLPALTTIAKQFNLKTEDALFAALGRGHIRMAQVLQAVQPKTNDKAPLPITTVTKPDKVTKGSALIGASDLLTRYAKCCKPIPGDSIIGYITQGRGISIHKKTCSNMKNVSDERRFIQIDWDSGQKSTSFSTDIKITAQENEKILHDITALFADEKIALLNFNSTFNRAQNKIIILVTVQIHNIEQLNHLTHRIQHLPGILEVTRVKN